MALRRHHYQQPSPSHRQRKRQTTFSPLSPARRLPSRFNHPKHQQSRPVLATLNLRRLPSRTYRQPLDSTDSMVALPVPVGSKRKRATTNENAHSGGRPTRGLGKLKRLRSTEGHNERYSSDETSSSMQVDDTPNKWFTSDESDQEQERQEQQEDDVLSELEDQASDDDFMLNRAPASRLRRLLKPELVRLHNLVTLSNDPESLTKSDLVDLIIDARDDAPEHPPSSPNRPGSTECSSADEGLGAEEDDQVPSYPIASSLRRRATFNGLVNGKPLANRTRSLGSMKTPSFDARRSTKLYSRRSAGSSGGSSRRGRTASHGSQSDRLPVLTPSPPATRLRTRQTSTSSIPSSSKGKGKSKAKHVEFDQHPHIASINDDGPENGDASGEESELTDLEVLERSMKVVEPSPRRLRSKDRTGAPDSETKLKPSSASSAGSVRRIVPKRKAKPRIGSLKEEDTEDENEEEVDELTEGEAEEEEEEVDELISIASTSTANETPRPRRNQRQSRPPISMSTSSDGDDEDSDADGGQDEDEDEAEAEDGEEEDDVTLIQPRVLRNGKVVGEEDEEEEEAEVEEMEVDSIPDDETITGDSVEGDVDEESPEGSDIEADTADIEVEAEQEDIVDDGIDLTAATAKTLVRLRRDDLLRLCEERELEASGTKPQLAAALLEWRDNHSGDFSSPSSTGTVRAPTTVRGRGRTRSAQDTPSTPVLERSHRVHLDEPLTPQVSDGQKEAEAEVELDLETLGLEGREIPPNQLTKIEKIGSGGFKDVYVGKWRRRKVAIAEFRGQLTAMDIKELKLLGGFEHGNIVRFLGVSIPENTKETPVMIVSELCSNGDLFDYIRNDKTMPTLRKMIDIMLDIAHGLNYLHNCDPSIIHRDCKSSNILITSKGTAKIADFGLAKVKESTRSLAGSLVGTVNWQAPELWVAHPQYDFKVDVFSCAMVYWEMMQWHLPEKKFPWEGMNEHAIYEVVKGKKDNRPPIDGLAKQWSPGLVDLMKTMWKHSPSERPTMAQVIDRLEELR